MFSSSPSIQEHWLFNASGRHFLGESPSGDRSWLGSYVPRHPAVDGCLVWSQVPSSFPWRWELSMSYHGWSRAPTRSLLVLTPALLLCFPARFLLRASRPQTTWTRICVSSLAFTKSYLWPQSRFEISLPFDRKCESWLCSHGGGLFKEFRL